MSKKWRRLASLVLVLLFLQAMLPTVALAIDEPADGTEPVVEIVQHDEGPEAEAERRDHMPPGTTPPPRDGVPKRGIKSLDPDAVAISDEIMSNFLLKPSDMFLWTSGFFLQDQYRFEEDDTLTYTETMRNSLFSLAQQATIGCKTDMERIEAVASWMAMNVGYDYDFINEKKSYPDIDPYSVMEKRYTVCAGYAKTCEYFLQSLGIPCAYVVTEDHAYNFAYNGERWVIFDSTWMSRSTIMFWGLMSR